MSKNTVALITNNLIVIVVHICMCFVFFLPLSYIWGFGVWFDDRSPELMDVIINLLVIGICITTILFLYFWAGKKFLSNTQHTPTNIFSVIVLSIIIFTITFIAYDSIWERILRLPFYPLGETISYFFQIEGKYCYSLLSFLPSLTMLAGMTIKWEKFRSFWQRKVKMSKNTVLIANNLIAIVIHAYMCLIVLFPVSYLWGGTIWFDSMLKWGLRVIIITFLEIGVITIGALLLYFLAGRKFLRNTHNALTNSFSVMVLAIIIMVTAFIAYDGIGELILMPFYPLGETISYFLQIEGKYVSLIIALLPSLTMLAGMMIKRKESHLL